MAFAKGLKDPLVASDTVIRATASNDQYKCTIQVAPFQDASGISKLLNEWFEDSSTTRSITEVTPEWIRSTYLARHAIWVVAKDIRGTIRGCVVSFFSKAPYPNSLAGCGLPRAWGIVDWFCVHPLWRSKGIGSALLETLDYIAHRIGRNAHMFIKEGLPLPLPNIPIYGTMWWIRRAGSQAITKMRSDSGVCVWPFQTKDRLTGLPMVRVEGIREKNPSAAQIKDWEDALDSELPPCWVFVTSVDKRDASRAWIWDSPVWLYSFRWTAGRWLGDSPDSEVL